MIKFGKNEFLRPQIYSTLDKYETRCNVTKEIIEEIEQLQQENQQLKADLEMYENGVYFSSKNDKLQQENEQLKEQIKDIDMWNKKYNEEFNKNKRLENNWNMLKEYIDKTKIKEFEKAFGKRYGKTFTQAEITVCNMIINKMKELERGVSE